MRPCQLARWVGGVLAGLMFLGGLGHPVASHAQAVLPDPAAPGPYAVGVTQRFFTRLSSTTGEPRDLATIIWYPPTLPAGAPPTHTFLAAPMNVPPDRTGGPYPVLLWSHGNGGTPWNATFFTTHLASHGFVVIAPLHPGNSAESCPQPCVDTYPPAQAARDEARANRPDDVMAVLDQALQASAGSDPLLAGLLDGQRVGVAGTSFGSQTALLVLARDARFRAAVATAPGAVPNLLAAVPSIAAPTMLLAGVLDDMNLFPQAETLFASFAPNQPPHWLVTLLRGGHFAFEDLCPPMSGGCDAESLPQEEAHALVNRWATAFLLRYVAGDERYAALLDPRTAGEEPEVRVSMEPSPY